MLCGAYPPNKNRPLHDGIRASGRIPHEKSQCSEIFVNGGGKAQTHPSGAAAPCEPENISSFRAAPARKARGGAAASLWARKRIVIPSSPARTARGGVVEESQRRQTEKQEKRSFGCTALRAALLSGSRGACAPPRERAKPQKSFLSKNIRIPHEKSQAPAPRFL